MWSPTTKEMPYEYDYDQQVPTERPTGSHPHPVPSHPPPADGNAGATSTGTAAGTGAAADDLSVSVGSTHAGSAAAGAGSSSVMRLVGQIAQESDNLRTELAKSYALTHAMSHALEQERIRQQARERQRGKAVQEEVDKEVVALLRLVGFGASSDGMVDTSGVGRDSPFDLFSTDEHGFTAMMWAAETGATRICEWLVAKGAGGLINHPDEDGATPLWYACSGGEETEEAALWLVEHGGADVRSRTCWDTACLTAACRSSTLAVCQSLVAHGAAPDLDRGALRAAVCHDRDLICHWLILLGCPPTVDDFTTPRTVEKRLLLDRLVHWAELELTVWDERVREVRRETKLGQAAGRGLFSSPGLEAGRHKHERTLKASLWAAPVVSPIRKRIPTAGRWLGGGEDDARWLGGVGGVGDFSVGDEPEAGAPSAAGPPAPHQRVKQGPPPQSPSSTHPRGVPRARPPPALNAQRLSEVRYVQTALAALRQIKDVA